MQNNIEHILIEIFGDSHNSELQTLLLESKADVENGHLSQLKCLKSFISSELEKHPPDEVSDSNDGRIGPSVVHFDVSSHVGSFLIGSCRLGIGSQSNFGSIRANMCVFKGKWQYEVLLGSKGIMQIGWATANCCFSQEKGVGDTIDSYAFDGNRLRRWNVETTKYGETWLSGDVIGCCIDLDNGIIEFSRNGEKLGTAFDNLRVLPGLAYFPAVSLAFGENLVANFGGSPLRYPVNGYLPLQDPPLRKVAKCNVLIGWMDKLTEWYMENKESHEEAGERAALFMLIGHHILYELGPLMTEPYMVDSCFWPYIVKLCGTKHGLKDIEKKTKLLTFLDVLWVLLEDYQTEKFLELVLVSILTRFREPASSIDLTNQRTSLYVLICIMYHVKTRKYLLKKVLFDLIRFPSFLHMKQFDIRGLVETMPEVSWEGKNDPIAESRYRESCQKISDVATEFEAMQIELLKMVLCKDDGSQSELCSRALFLIKFRSFIKENMLGNRVPVALQTPLPVKLSFLHRLIVTLQYFWEIEHPNKELVIPVKMFYDDSLKYFDVHRLGGLVSHLKKLHKCELGGQPISSECELNNTVSTGTNTSSHALQSQGAEGGNDLFDLLDPLGLSPVTTSIGISIDERNPGPDFDPIKQPTYVNSDLSLVELLDGVIWLYHIGAHKQLVKMSLMKNSLEEFATALQMTQQKIDSRAEAGLTDDVVEQLERAKTVFTERLTIQARNMGWINSVIYSPRRQKDILWLLRTTLRTLLEASKSGKMFTFVPHFYLESTQEMFTALRSFFSVNVPLREVEGIENLITDVGMFFVEHFVDERVVYAESKDTLIQTLASLVCEEMSLGALEKMPVESREKMIKLLLRPYENRAWAQSNWILVRLWKGNGFGFRYTKSPHLAKKVYPRYPQGEMDNMVHSNHHQKPCPSELFQNLIADTLLTSEETSTCFLNSLLNQLNWAFSEFIGMVQEIQNASNRPERVFIDSRQLKICATCFDLTLSLLRVLEMVVHVARKLFIDKSHSSSELLLARLCQLLSQVFNRICSRSGCFDHVVSMEVPGLESVDHYPILTAVTGVLIALIYPEASGCAEGNEECEVPATRALLSEPSFQLSSLNCLLGKDWEVSKRASGFCLLNYPEEISKIEIEKLETTVLHLEGHQKSITSDPRYSGMAEELCTICYAFPISAKFLPCNHVSCRACISHHLMNRSDCFFCKTFIENVVDLDDNPLQNLWTKK